jgi:hydroxyethylthiazole kinase-like uncharacterized protein yjeF
MATVCADRGDSLALYSVAQVRAIEAAALSAVGPGILMQRAGAAVARRALALLPEINANLPVLFAAGPGNNGGDALEAAALLAENGVNVTIIHLANENTLTADARMALTRARQSRAVFVDSLPALSWSLAVDGLFGIGLTRPLEGRYRDLATQLNQLSCPVLAIDVPSGLDADTGGIVGQHGMAVRADETLTFIANKPGLHTLHGRDSSGHVVTDDLGIDKNLFPEPVARLNTPLAFADEIHPRLHASHKGSYGDLQIIGGAEGMSGAVVLAARMALMAGAGRVFAGFAGPVPAYDTLHPELMCRHAGDLRADDGAVVIGPGLGMSRHAHDLLGRALSFAPAVVIDADGLNLIAAEPPLQHRLAQRRAPTLLTPHPLEAARLLATDVHAVQSNRLGSANELARRFHATVILKGSGSIIAQPGDIPTINTTGNPALATAGSGDVLAGLCGALLAQGWSAWACALAATWSHGSAADQMVADGTGPTGATASELMPWIRSALNRLVSELGARP